jgi:hypothetical protein
MVVHRLGETLALGKAVRLERSRRWRDKRVGDRRIAMVKRLERLAPLLLPFPMFDPRELFAL